MSTPGNRELVFCHECENEWYRDQHGLKCNECQSEFTEIIEADHDPRAERFDQLGNEPNINDMPGSHFVGDGPPLPPRPSSMHGNDDPMHSLHNHNPWAAAPDPGEEDIGGIRFTRNPGAFGQPRGFHFEHTFTPGRQRQTQTMGGRSQNQQPLGNTFLSMIQGMVGMAAAPADRGFPPLGAQPGAGGDGSNVRTVTREGPNHRFTYTTTTRIYPRDASNAQPAGQPVDQLGPLLAQMFGPNGIAAAGFTPERGHGGADGAAGANQQFPPTPMMNLLSTLLGTGPRAQGDYVFTQEHLDRVISQLMEQNQTGSAPGPASQDAIKSLPKRPITEKDLGAEHRAECSICMDEVNIGEEVTFLPCTHWFHDQCVKAWLNEHDTCPHCRKSITDSANQAQSGSASGSGLSSSAPGGLSSSAPGGSSSNMPPPLSTTPPRQMPGAFDTGSPTHNTYMGAGTQSSPIHLDPGSYNSRPATSRHSSHQSHQSHRSTGSRRSSHSHSDSNGGGGITSRVRNFFTGGGGSGGGQQSSR